MTKLLADMKQITVASSLDGSSEPSLFYAPPETEGAPLLVGLHTWSADRFNQQMAMLEPARQRGWGLLLPEFRGPNLESNPRALEAAGSKLACQDIADAVDFVLGEFAFDRQKLFLLGGSGGGHMALMMAGYRPELFLGVSAWCPITDMAAWHRQNDNYRPHVTAVCGGNPPSNPKPRPDDNSEVAEHYRQKSPMTHAAAISRANICVHHGRHDAPVPYSHTVNLAAAVEAHNPEHFYYEIFDGGHEMRVDRGLDWFESLLTVAAEDASRPSANNPSSDASPHQAGPSIPLSG